MTTKPELLAGAASLEEIERLISAGADAFVIGESRYGMRLPGNFDSNQISEAVKIAKPHGVRIYAALNNLMDNETVKTLPGYIQELSDAGVDGIVFGDPAVLMTVRSIAPEMKLHWNAEMTSTNYETANYWGRRGAARFVLARELNMEQVLETKAHTDLEIQVQVHGLTNIYHSKRPLVHNYLDHHEKSERTPLTHELETSTQPRGKIEDGLYLIEMERPDERFPIYEDSNGTHIMSSDDLCMLENLHELMEVGIHSFKIETLLKSIAYNEVVIRSYRAAIDAYFADPEGYSFREEWLDAITAVQDPARELSFGFFYKEQVY
ncbi:putative protease YrrN [Paenibacillus baekrokdamisoli]|uniref:Putative protease YrrN n=1 Tax=Paenibacillus baekrokdamisoli TaxID=1712516 RepID=A0A3G9IJZ3_9BACL|nr:peptidase U32 family protein [Paenibacillus baekrokdamisoli]MBB3067498.1 putative protease [Paenibacillus baekrokdamisoli]BBH19317.1 putative protease YrrN [Paenibacillus baekrokdamisoli]